MHPYSTGMHTPTFHDDIMFLYLLCVPCVSMYEYVCVFILRPEVDIRHLPLLLSHFVFHLGVFSWSWSSWFWMNWLATEPWHPPVSTPPVLGLQGYAAMLGFWHECCELRSLCSHSKSLTLWATCPACDLIVVSHRANSQCLLPLNGQENWHTLGDKLLPLKPLSGYSSLTMNHATAEPWEGSQPFLIFPLNMMQ